MPSQVNVHSGKRQWVGWMLILLCALFYCYEYFLRISPGVMVDHLMRFFGINGEQVGDLQQAYFYAYTPMQLGVGVLIDRYKSRYLLPGAVIACVCGTLMMSMTHSLGVAEMGRFLQGFGSAFAFVGTLKVASMSLPTTRFAFISGCCSSLGFLGAMFGQISLAEMVDRIGWQSTLVNAALLGVVLAVCIFLMLQDRYLVHVDRAYGEIDFKQVLLSLVNIAKNPAMWLIGIVSGLMFMPNPVLVTLWGIPFLSQDYHLSNVSATAAISLVFMGWAIGSPIQGWLADRTGKGHWLVGLGCLLAGSLLLVILFVPMSNIELHLVLLFFGVASSAQVICFALAYEHVSRAFAGGAMAFTNCLTMVAGMFVPGLIGWLLDRSWLGTMRDGARVYRVVDFQHALVVVPGCLFTAAFFVFLITVYDRKKKIAQA